MMNKIELNMFINNKIQSTILIGIILLIFEIKINLGHRITTNDGNSDSILDIIKTDNVQRMLSERRHNITTRRNYMTKNDLDDNEFPSDPLDRINEGNINLYQTPGSGISIDYHQLNQQKNRIKNRNRHHKMNKINNLQFLKYNDTIPIPTGNDESLDNMETNPDLLHDLQSFRTDKMLKSSKNALIVTKKEYLKKDWCKTEPLVQRIREDGCLSKTIINRFCYGQCNSFYIPKSPKRNKRNHNANNLRSNTDQFEDEDLTGAAFRSCAFCKPKRFTWITVTLRCPSMVPQLRKKRIQRIKQCKCIAEPLN